MPRPDERFRHNLARSLRAIALLGSICVVGQGAAQATPQTRSTPAPRVAVQSTAIAINNLSYDAERHSLVLDISGPVTISTRSL
jgi:hypothetical protein